MILTSKKIVRQVTNTDRTQLANMVHFGTYVHRHLDWRQPLEWIDKPAFYVVESYGRILAALSCAPDPADVAWIRLFVTNSQVKPPEAWKMMWPEIEQDLKKTEISVLAAIPIQKWLQELLPANGFKMENNVVSLAWDAPPETALAEDPNLPIRLMTESDIAQVVEVDRNAFKPLWQNSRDLIHLAFSQAALATVAYDEQGIIGYQITTPTQYGAHLGRLAVLPRAQGKGIGIGLVRNLQNFLSKQKPIRISVNTQTDNQRSLSLYKKAGFTPTSETFPVYVYPFE